MTVRKILMLLPVLIACVFAFAGWTCLAIVCGVLATANAYAFSEGIWP